MEWVTCKGKLMAKNANLSILVMWNLCPHHLCTQCNHELVQMHKFIVNALAQS